MHIEHNTADLAYIDTAEEGFSRRITFGRKACTVNRRSTLLRTLASSSTTATMRGGLAKGHLSGADANSMTSPDHDHRMTKHQGLAIFLLVKWVVRGSYF